MIQEYMIQSFQAVYLKKIATSRQIDTWASRHNSNDMNITVSTVRIKVYRQSQIAKQVVKLFGIYLDYKYKLFMA